MADTLAVSVVQYQPVQYEAVQYAAGQYGPVRDHPSQPQPAQPPTGNSGAGSWITANALEHVRLIEDADSHGSRVVLFPELSLTGYRLDILVDDAAWLVPDDERLSGIHEICRRTGITAVIGAPYREADGTPRLASLVLHPDGSIETAFKTHLHDGEAALFVPGEDPRVIDVDGWRLALALCLDTSAPRQVAAAAEFGADAYCVAGLYTRADADRLALHLGARAMDYRMFTLLANLGGRTPLGESCGQSGVWSPDGLPLKQAAGTGTEVVPCLLQRSVLKRLRQENESTAPGRHII